MKPRSFITAFVLPVALLLISGCWSSEPVTSPDRQPADRPATGVGGQESFPSVAPEVNKIQTLTLAGAPALEFNGTKFVLLTRADLVNQYVPQGQTLENWQAMFALRRFPELSSPGEAIANVMASLQSGNPQWRQMATPGRRPEIEQAIDFVIWNEDKSLTEFNIHIYRRDRSGQGLIANMYLMRGYGIEGHQALMAIVGENRQGIVNSIMDSHFPTFIESQLGSVR